MRGGGEYQQVGEIVEISRDRDIHETVLFHITTPEPRTKCPLTHCIVDLNRICLSLFNFLLGVPHSERVNIFIQYVYLAMDLALVFM